VAAIDVADIVAGLYSHLTGDSDFNTAIGGSGSTAGRLRFRLANKSETYPYCVFHVISLVGEDNMTTDGYFIRFQFDIWESEEAGPRACMDVADDLRARMTRATYTITNHEQTQIRLDTATPPALEGTAWVSRCDYVAQGLRS